jgi:hypothetical protein
MTDALFSHGISSSLSYDRSPCALSRKQPAPPGWTASSLGYRTGSVSSRGTRLEHSSLDHHVQKPEYPVAEEMLSKRSERAKATCSEISRQQPPPPNAARCSLEKACIETTTGRDRRWLCTANADSCLGAALGSTYYALRHHTPAIVSPRTSRFGIDMHIVHCVDRVGIGHFRRPVHAIIRPPRDGECAIPGWWDCPNASEGLQLRSCSPDDALQQAKGRPNCHGHPRSE